MARSLRCCLRFGRWVVRKTCLPSVLFRDCINGARRRPRAALIVIMAVLGALLVALAVSTSEPRSIALYVLAGSS